jgi:NADH-quinone oxidoreductase subunit L
MSLLNLAWLIPAFPLAAFVAIVLYAHRDRELSHALALGGMGAAFVLAQTVFWRAVTLPVGSGEGAFRSVSLPWLTLGGEALRLGVYVDPAAAIMLFMVPLVCLMIFVYSVGYMHGDPRYSRFFAYISLFATGMLGLVVFDNLLTFFIFWEIMGTCSYLLIGFWYEKPSAYAAGLKAFLVTRVGDLFFLLGLVTLYSRVGSLAYAEVFAPATLEALAEPGFLGTNLAPATVIALLLFGGTVGKAAQFPLHVWLPDAMEGPTPVSALIHAATMVSAGVFLVVRAYPLFTAVEGGPHLPVVAAIGTFTALFASVVALAQDDIKRVLAFSTISQLGYMVAALGVGAYVAATFHLITHAFFKALLFLGSGSVIHAMEHAHHAVGEHGADHAEPFDPNDMFNMGGLARRMPRTFWSFLAGGLALSGFPIVTAGFWSKDEILAQAYDAAVGGRAVFWTLAGAAFLTAFYTARQLSLAFLGEARTEVAAHVEESVPSMTVPLMVLAVFSVALGWVGIPEHFPLIGGLVPNWFHDFVGGPMAHVAPPVDHAGQLTESATWQPLVTGLTAALGGLLGGWLVYGRRPLEAGEPDRVAAALRWARLGWLYRAMQERFYVDEAYEATFVRASVLLADFAYAFDRAVVDRVVVGMGAAVRAVSRASAAFDARVIDALVNGAGRGARALSQGAAWFDARVVDGFVDATGRITQRVSSAAGYVDRVLIDGLVNGVHGAAVAFGRVLRSVQTGYLQDYLWLALLAVVALVATFFM